MPPSAPTAGPRRSFGLLRFFLTAAALTLAVVTAIAGAVSAWAEQRDLLTQGRHFAEKVAAHIEHRIGETVGLDALATPSSDPGRRASLDAAVASATAGLRVRRVNIFDPGGSIVYSTRAETIGRRVEDNEHLDTARAGETAAEFKDERAPLDTGGLESTPLLEVYVPSAGPPGRGPRRVIEVYLDAEDLGIGLNMASLRVAVASAISMLVTIAVLFAVFLRGDRLIRQQTGALTEANAALEKLTGDLERLVEERTTRLVASERMAAVGTLATGIAHEINNPLAAITAAVEGLLRRMERGPIPPEQQAQCKEYLEIIRDESFRAKAITRDLLDFGRQEPAAAAPVQANDLVRSVAALVELRPRRHPAPIELDLAPDADLPLVAGSPGKLRQVIFNVTDNAVDALGEGGGKVVWTTRREESEGGAAIVLRCRDDGAGMAPETLARAFDPFFTTKEPGKGTGLGLAISYGIVQSHGGTIAAASDGPGRGTLVTIRLPAAGATVAASRPEAP